MFKRANKVTALLVAAASVMSIVPAMAADSARLGTKDGTIENAVAYKDGKYLYQGYRSDDDDEGIYYNAGDKDKLLDEIEDADLNGSFGEKYASVDDGDEYLVDLTNGDVTDDITPTDSKENTETKLKSKLSKTDRYDDVVAANITVDSVGSSKFGETWYEYSVANSKEDNAKLTGSLYGFTNEKGDYVDVSNLANIYAFSTTKGKVVKVSEFDDKDDDANLEVKLAAAPEFLAQDKDYIYVKTNVNVYDTDSTAIGTSTSTQAAADGSSLISHRTYIQKISKAQGDKKDDAYVPKTVASYEVTKGEFDCDDADDAKDAIAAATDYTVVGDKLLAIKKTADNVEVTSFNLKKDKVKFLNIKANADEKVDVYFVEKDDSDDQDVDSDSDHAYSKDVNGNVWLVNDGKIYKFANNEFTKVYNTDSSLDSLSVYDEKNLIAWENEGDIYTTVNEGTAQTAADAAVVTPPAVTVKAGWAQLTDGTWNFNDATGTKVTSKWVNVGGAWYYLKADGVMATGWLNDNGTWYYLAGSGAMLANTTVDGYKLGASGAWIR